MSHTLSDSGIMAELTQILRDVLDAPDLIVRPQTTAAEVPGWDSMKHILIVMGVQEKFGIRLKPREIDRLNNVGDLAAVIAEHTGKQTRV
jgi:acyl carrier protein